MSTHSTEPKRITAMVEFLATLGCEDLSRSLTDQAIRCILDSIACGVFGSEFPWGRIIRDVALADGSQGNASVFGCAASMSPSRAALCNGAMMHGFELDDIMLEGMCHCGAVIVSAALAMAEHCHASTERFLLGTVAGYEAVTRVGAALGDKANTRGVHTTGFAGAVGAAVAAGLIADLGPERIACAVGIACSSASGIKAFVQGGGMVKRFHPGKAAESGVFSSLLAERGFTAPLRAIDGQCGLLEAIAGDHSRPELLSMALGESWAINRTWIKLYACCGQIHSTIQALERIIQRERVLPDDVDQVRIGLARRALAHNGQRAPQDVMSAQYSIPFCAALTIVGDIRDPGSFSTERLGDPKLEELSGRVLLEVNEDINAAFPGAFGSAVELITKQGKRISETVWSPHGTPDDPCSDDEVVGKFKALTRASHSPEAGGHLLQAIIGLKSGGSISRLSHAIRSLSCSSQPSLQAVAHVAHQ